jgi:CheY-like chemotaxis protein
MTTVKAILQKKYTIIEAYDGESGLKKALKHLPTIVLLDISLPKMDGIEVVKILKKTKETKNIPVIALTARAMKEDRDTFIKAGCDDYISKPVDSIILLNKIEEWI